MISSDRSDNPHKLLMIIPMISLEESYDDIQRRRWYPQKTVAICAENIGSVFWVQNILTGLMCCNKNWSLISIFPLYIYISELFDGYQTILKTPQNFLEEPSKFSEEPSEFPEESSGFFEDPHPQTFGRPSQFSENHQNFLRILRKFWGWRSRKILKMRILRKFWGWGSFENYESSSQNVEESSGNS